MIIVFTGNGKGKTTAALGTALRAFGHEKKVLLIMFLKEFKNSGEVLAIDKINSDTLKVKRFGRYCENDNCTNCQKQVCIVTKDNISIEDDNYIRAGIEYASKQILSKNWDVIVLDEIINVYNIFPKYQEHILDLLNNSESIDLIITGRNCVDEILSKADMVSSIEQIKHPYQKGESAKRGIDY